MSQYGDSRNSLLLKIAQLVADGAGLAANRFSVTLTPSSLTLSPGETADITITTTLTAGAAEAAVISVLGLPTGVLATHDDNISTDGGSVVLTLEAESDAPLVLADSFTVRVTAVTLTRNKNGTVTVNIVPVITSEPEDVRIDEGQTTTLTVGATGLALTYQWYVGASGVTTSPISGATSASYLTPAAGPTNTNYWVRVTNPVGSDDSATASVGPVDPAEVNRTVSGLIFAEDFASLADWTLHGNTQYTADTTEPEYVLHPFDRVLVDLAVSGITSAGMREPLPIIDGSNLYIYCDGNDGTNPWAATAITLSDNWLTIDARTKLDLPNPNTHYSICNGFTRRQDGTYYLYALQTDEGPLVEQGVPAPPYGNAFYSNSNPVTGTWTLVRDDNPALVAGDTSNVYQVFEDPDSPGNWIATASCGTNPWHAAIFRHSDPLGPWPAPDDADWLPADVQGATYGGTENPRPWLSTALGIWVVTCNEITNLIQRSGLYYADSFAELSTDVRHVTVITPSATNPFARNTVSPASPIFDFNATVEQDANGFVGFVYGGDPQSAAVLNDQRIRCGQLAPHPAALLFEGIGDSTQRVITRTQGAANFVAEFTVEMIGDVAGSIGFLFSAATDGTDAGTTGYLLYIPTAAGDAASALYRAGSVGDYQLADATSYPARPYEANGTNRYHRNVRVVKNGGDINVWVNGEEVIDYTDGSPLVGTLCGWRDAAGDMRILGLSLRTGGSVTINGTTNGDVVSLHGAGKLPAVAGTASGASITLTHSHFPLFGIQVNGTYFATEEPIYGGDVFTYTP